MLNLFKMNITTYSVGHRITNIQCCNFTMTFLECIFRRHVDWNKSISGVTAGSIYVTPCAWCYCACSEWPTWGCPRVVFIFEAHSAYSSSGSIFKRSMFSHRLSSSINYGSFEVKLLTLRLSFVFGLTKYFEA